MRSLYGFKLWFEMMTCLERLSEHTLLKKNQWVILVVLVALRLPGGIPGPAPQVAACSAVPAAPGAHRGGAGPFFQRCHKGDRRLPAGRPWASQSSGFARAGKERRAGRTL